MYSYSGLKSISYFKYLISLLYFHFMDMPLMIRVCASMVILCVLVMIVIMIDINIQVSSGKWRERQKKKMSDKYLSNMVLVSSDTVNYSVEEIKKIFRLPANFKMGLRKYRVLVQLFLEVREVFGAEGDGLNERNFHNMQTAFGLPGYFEKEILDGRLRFKLRAFKVIDQIDGDLKETVAARYLFAKDQHLQLRSRLHSARIGEAKPFNPLEEDQHQILSPDIQARYHEIWKYRLDHGMTIPNLIQWCTRDDAPIEAKVFCMREIGLLGLKQYCPYLPSLLMSTKDDRLREATVRTIGDLKYGGSEIEEILMGIYFSSSNDFQRTILSTLREISSDNQTVIDFLVKQYGEVNDYYMRETILSVLYRYGDAGKFAFRLLKAQSEPQYKIFFEHVESPYIDSTRYA